MGTESTTIGNTTGEVLKAGSAKSDHSVRCSNNQLASVRVAVNSFTLPDGKLAAPLTSILRPSIFTSS